MNRTALKNFAEWAREMLLADVGTESAAYAWFSRIIALRYMAVNGYLPVGIELSSVEDDLILKENVFKGCDFLTSSMPFIFEEVPEGISSLKEIIHRFCYDIPDEEFKDQVEIIGWLHQYYNGAPKDETYALLKQNVKITKDRVPSVTQLFTPHWIVRYMVENSLGRLWLESHPDSDLANEMPYYVSSEKQYVPNKMDAEYIHFIDPCMGSGNILIYAFDLLMRIYREQNYDPVDAARLILKKNLFGLDIDVRAEHLTAFALLMKARKYDKDIFSCDIVPNVYAIVESNDLELPEECSPEQLKILQALKDRFLDAGEYGSVLAFSDLDLNENIPSAFSRLGILHQMLTASYDVVVTNPPYMGSVGMNEKLGSYVKEHYPDAKEDLFSVFIERCALFTRPEGYYALITQPSLLFLSSFESLRKMVLCRDSILSLLHLGRGIFGVDFGSVAFVLRHSSDKDYVGEYFRLHERNFQYLDADDIGKLFLRSLSQKDLRYDFRSYDTKTGIIFKDAPVASTVKVRFQKRQGDFLKLPGTPFAYWVSDFFSNAMEKGIALGKIAEPRQGLATTDNKKYLRYWFEIPRSSICFDMSSTEEAKKNGGKWFPYNKGGEYRKWYGNLDYVVDYAEDGKSIKDSVLRKYPYLKTPDFVVKNTSFYFKPCFSWSLISSGVASFRYKPQGYIFDVAGMSCFSDEDLFYLLGLCNSVVASKVLEIIAPTINYQCGDIAKIPVIFCEDKREEIEALVKENIALVKEDWDSFELSLDFREHPLVRGNRISAAFSQWEQECEKRFDRLRFNEERLDRLFLEIYGLAEELPVISDPDKISVHRGDLGRDIRSLLSYFVGCVFRRFDRGATTSKIIPLTEENLFSDDLIGLLCHWLSEVYGMETLEENLDFIAGALGGKGAESRDIIRSYFLRDFMKDHIRLYRKRPIYWQFTSGKKRCFHALVYAHHWYSGILTDLRQEYLLPLISVMETEKSFAGWEKCLAECKSMDDKLKRLENISTEIDLDDGIAYNYKKVQTDADGDLLDVLVKI